MRTINYLKALTSALVVRVVGACIGLWLTPFVLRHVSRSEYSVLVLASDVVLWLGLLDLGITGALRVQAAQLREHGDERQLAQLLSTALFAQCVLAVIVVGAGLLLAGLFPALVRLPGELALLGRQVFLLMVMSAAFNLLGQVFDALINARQRAHLRNCLALLSSLLSTMLTVGLLRKGFRVLSVVLAGVLSTGVSLILGLFVTLRILPEFRLRVREFSFATLRSMASVGAWLTVGAIAEILINRLDRVVTSHVVSLPAVTALYLTSRTYMLASTIISEVSRAARPMLGQLAGTAGIGPLRRAFRDLWQVSAGSGLLLAAALWAANRAFVTRWVGKHNYAGWPVDLVCALNLLVRAWYLPNGTLLTAGLFQIPGQALCKLCEGLLNLGLSLALGWHLGLVGVVLGTTLGTLCTSAWYVPRHAARLLRVSPAALLKEETARFVPITAVVMTLATAIRFLTGTFGGFGGAVLSAAVVSAFAAQIIWCRFLHDSLKLRAWSIIGRYYPQIQVSWSSKKPLCTNNQDIPSRP